MKRLALLGAGGHGKVVADMAGLVGWDKISFFDDAWPQLIRNGHWGIVGDSTVLLSRLSQFDGVLVSIGDCEMRWERHSVLQSAGAVMATIVHPAAIISPYATLGAGTVVMAGTVLNVDVAIGQAAIINTGATVDHDCRLGDAVHICPGAHLSGNVRVGNRSWVGVGAVVKQGIVIGEKALVGAGAVVVRNVAAGLTVVGNPARSVVVPTN
ncbi:acetyltransferase [Pusillimonas sp. NJUB218]|uniref:acetyltransferase n=1 Tax=Pusillimonas sp. NJUB218 TaxID=2023230 RepID=UPI000F4CA96A|nr:acetyltransferase [Pusillimonas sp. NJUB218]ROT46368.1 acetyltransferase [Pusillimonas sp. NJUB218]